MYCIALQSKEMQYLHMDMVQYANTSVWQRLPSVENICRSLVRVQMKASSHMKSENDTTLHVAWLIIP